MELNVRNIALIPITCSLPTTACFPPFNLFPPFSYFAVFQSVETVQFKKRRHDQVLIGGPNHFRLIRLIRKSFTTLWNIHAKCFSFSFFFLDFSFHFAILFFLLQSESRNWFHFRSSFHAFICDFISQNQMTTLAICARRKEDGAKCISFSFKISVGPC